MAHVGGRYADIKNMRTTPWRPPSRCIWAGYIWEWIVRDAFEKNYRVGIVANSDGHKGRPGVMLSRCLVLRGYGGLTCFLAERLDRDTIFESMRRRHHYATTGNRALFERNSGKRASDAELF